MHCDDLIQVMTRSPLGVRPRPRPPHLVEDLLEPRGAHLFGHMSVGGVGHEELPLSLEGRLNVLLTVDVLLTAVHHPDVSWEHMDSSMTLYQRLFSHKIDR